MQGIKQKQIVFEKSILMKKNAYTSIERWA
jgi:hypothetical protein